MLVRNICTPSVCNPQASSETEASLGSAPLHENAFRHIYTQKHAHTHRAAVAFCSASAILVSLKMKVDLGRQGRGRKSIPASRRTESH